MAQSATTLARAAELIEQFEGVETEAYLDPIGVPTICAGITRYPDNTAVRMGDVCSSSVCRGHLEFLLRDQYVPAMEQIPGWFQLAVDQQAVLLSFAWNLGKNFFRGAGFNAITEVLQEGATNPSAYVRMPSVLELYVNAGGRPWPGLIARRKKEGSIWAAATNSVITFRATQDTVLKAAPIDRALLSPLGLQSVEKDETVSVARLEEIAANAHVWLTLASDGRRWAAFAPHWAHVDGSPVISQRKPAPLPSQVINWDDFNARVGQYITVGDVLQYDKRRKPVRGSQAEKNILNICKQFDAIRTSWEGPIGVTSGYRPEPINSQVGGVPGSKHVTGEALDIYPIGVSIDKFHHWLKQRWTGGYGDGRRRGFIHIDTRANGMFRHQGGVRPAVIWDY